MLALTITQPWASHAALRAEIDALRAALAEACDIGMRWACALNERHNDPQDRTRLAELRKLCAP